MRCRSRARGSSSSPVAARWRCASGASAARCGAAARRCSPARRWRRAQPGRGSGSGGSWRGSPRASCSPERDPPSNAAAHRASPEGRIREGDTRRGSEYVGEAWCSGSNVNTGQKRTAGNFKPTRTETGSHSQSVLWCLTERRTRVTERPAHPNVPMTASK